MMPYIAKRLFFTIAAPLMRLNGLRHKVFPIALVKKGPLRVHLGPGQRSYLPGWVNVDANMFTGKCDIWYDFHYPIPFEDASLDALYSHHVIEHLSNLAEHLKDAFRALRPGGVYRLGGPHGDNAIAKFIEGSHEWFTNYPDNRTSIGGRLDNFIFCRREHVCLLTRSFLEELLVNAGFEVIGPCMPTRSTNYPALFTKEVLTSEFESDFEAPHTIILEAKKPLKDAT